MTINPLPSPAVTATTVVNEASMDTMHNSPSPPPDAVAATLRTQHDIETSAAAGAERLFNTHYNLPSLGFDSLSLQGELMMKASPDGQWVFGMFFPFVQQSQPTAGNPSGHGEGMVGNLRHGNPPNNPTEGIEPPLKRPRLSTAEPTSPAPAGPPNSTIPRDTNKLPSAISPTRELFHSHYQKQVEADKGFAFNNEQFEDAADSGSLPADCKDKDPQNAPAPNGLGVNDETELNEFNPAQKLQCEKFATLMHNIEHPYERLAAFAATNGMDTVGEPRLAQQPEQQSTPTHHQNSPGRLFLRQPSLPTVSPTRDMFGGLPCDSLDVKNDIFNSPLGNSANGIPVGLGDNDGMCKAIAFDPVAAMPTGNHTDNMAMPTEATKPMLGLEMPIECVGQPMDESKRHEWWDSIKNKQPAYEEGLYQPQQSEEDERLADRMLMEMDQVGLLSELDRMEPELAEALEINDGGSETPENSYPIQFIVEEEHQDGLKAKKFYMHLLQSQKCRFNYAFTMRRMPGFWKDIFAVVRKRGGKFYGKYDANGTYRPMNSKDLKGLFVDALTGGSIYDWHNEPNESMEYLRLKNRRKHS